MKIKGKNIVITGAGSGMGRELALQLSGKGAFVIITDLHPEGLEETKNLLSADGHDCMSLVFDIADEEAFRNCAVRVIEQCGHVDGLINNAGVLARAESFLDMDMGRAHMMMNVNFWGMVHGVRAFFPHIAKRAEGTIVNFSSSLGMSGVPMQAPYCAAKAANIYFTDVVRMEARNFNISLISVLPGATKTNLGRNAPAISDEDREKAAASFDNFAITKPETVAARVIRAMERGKSRVVVGADSKVQYFLARFFPAFYGWLMGKYYRKLADPDQFTSLDQMADQSQRKM